MHSCIEKKLCLAVIYSVFMATNAETGLRREKRSADNFPGNSVSSGDEGYAGMWFGPRLGKRAPNRTPSDRSSLLHLLEAADILKYYYDRLPNSLKQRNNIDWNSSMVENPRTGRSETKKADETINFTPRLGRTVDVETDSRYSDESFLEDPPIFSPRLGRNAEMNFSPRLGRNADIHFSPRLGRDPDNLNSEVSRSKRSTDGIKH